MNDVTTHQPLRVSIGGITGPYVMIPVCQLDEVQQLLDGESIAYWVEENAISLNGSPEIAVIDFGRDGDAEVIQAILDKTN